MPQLRTSSAIEFKLPNALQRRVEEMERMNSVVKEPNPANVSEAGGDNAEGVQIENVAPTPEPTPDKPTPPKVDEWEHKFKTLQGMYNSEKRRTATELVEAQEKIKALESSLVAVEKTIPKKWDIRKYISAEELEKYDEEQLHTVLKATLSAASEEVETLVKKEMSPLRDELEAARKNAKEVATDAFFTMLDVGVPDWREVNNDPKFHAWLAEPDELSGVERQAALTAAEQQLNGKRVIAIFKAFLKTQTPQVDESKARLERKVLPDVSVPTVVDNVSGNGGEAISRRAIREFYENVRKGRVTRQQQMDMERRIQAAISNNRVID